MNQISPFLLALACAVTLGAQAPMDSMAVPPPATHAHMASANPAEEKVEAPESCVRCGMNRTKFAHSRMMIAYEDGSMAGTCSLHCMATELGMSKSKPVKSLLTADYANKKRLVDAKDATWVIGGSQKGVMTKIPKWAFEKKQAAEMFIQMSGGTLATYAEVLELATRE